MPGYPCCCKPDEPCKSYADDTAPGTMVVSLAGFSEVTTWKLAGAAEGQYQCAGCSDPENATADCAQLNQDYTLNLSDNNIDDGAFQCKTVYAFQTDLMYACPGSEGTNYLECVTLSISLELTIKYNTNTNLRTIRVNVQYDSDQTDGETTELSTIYEVSEEADEPYTLADLDQLNLDRSSFSDNFVVCKATNIGGTPILTVKVSAAT